MANQGETEYMHERQISSFLVVANAAVAEALSAPTVSHRHVEEAIKALCSVKIMLINDEKKAA